MRRRQREIMRIVCLSDTHNLADQVRLPAGDLLLHAGDLTMAGSSEEVQEARAWLASLPHRHKVVIAGNHDFLFEREPALARRMMRDFVYLEDERVEIEGLRIWGSPWQPWFFDWAFNLERGAAIRAKWDLIPTEIDVLITHGPPAGHGDLTDRGERVGCVDLLAAVRRIAPALHVFGHIHEGYGATWEGATLCVNASVCDAGYRPINAPIVVDWPPGR
jgi:Icc-related predicted phosphoesterase